MFLIDRFEQNLLWLLSVEGLREELSFSRYELEKYGLPSTRRYWNNTEAVANVLYANRFGNYKYDDGYRYIGRGYIKIRGRDNYMKLEEWFGYPFVDHPEMLEDRRIAHGVAEIFRPWLEDRLLKDFNIVNLDETNLRNYF